MNISSSSSLSRLQPTGSTGKIEQPSGVQRLTPQEAALRGASLAFQKQQNQAQEGGHTHKTGVGNGGVSRQTTGASNNGGRISRQPTGSSVRSQRDYADEAADRERERDRKALFLSSTVDQGKSLHHHQQQQHQHQQHLMLPPGARPSGALATDPKSASFIAATLAASRRSASPGTAPGAEVGAGVVRRTPLREPVDLRRGSAASGSLDELTDTTSLAPATSLISLFEGQRGTDDIVKGSTDKQVNWKLKSVASKNRMGVDGSEDGELDQGSVESVSNPEARPMKSPRVHEDKAGLEVASFRLETKPKQSPKNPRADIDVGETGPSRPAQKPKPILSKPEFGGEREVVESDRKNMESAVTTPRLSPGPKPRTVARPETPPSPVFRRANTEIMSPKPRRPETKPILEVPSYSSNSNENSDMTVENMARSETKTPCEAVEASPQDPPQADQGENKTARQPIVPRVSPAISVKSRPPTPRKPTVLSERLLPELRRQSIRRSSVIAIHDGQEEPKLRAGQDSLDPRPTTSESRSSNDTFVSASSVPVQDDADSLLTVDAPSSRSITPKVRTSRPTSVHPSVPLPVRQSVTGSSQLTVHSLSNAILAGSLASARHTPSSVKDNSTPPPLPPSRRKGGSSSTTTTKNKPSSRRPSPHRMKHTLRQPKSHSDDEGGRRPHHKKGLNRKKHAHHEGSRSRWREEITEREKKRYEALWASNRGALLVAAQQACADPDGHPASHQLPRQPLRNESYEELSEHVANVIVRDIWSRSRLPEPELAEVWDLVYGHGQSPGNVVHGALNKQQFVVGMWLIDQRLRGRKIPPRVSESVWDSAKGLRVLNPDHHHGYGHKGKKGKVR